MAHPPLPAPGATRPGFPPRGRGRGSSAEGGLGAGPAGGQDQAGPIPPQRGTFELPRATREGPRRAPPGGTRGCRAPAAPIGAGRVERRGRGAAIAGLPN